MLLTPDAQIESMYHGSMHVSRIVYAQDAAELKGRSSTSLV